MKKIIFVCYGNICRSPIAEFVMKDLIAKANHSEEFEVKSAGCHAVVGSSMSNGTRTQLTKHNIPFTKKSANQLTKADYQIYDYIIGMDKSNVDDMKLIFDGDTDNKVHLMMSFAGENRDVADPWYTDDFDTTYEDILKGCQALLNKILSDSQN